MAKYYAWAPITIADSTKLLPKGFATVSVGDEVSKNQVGDDWKDLIAAGVIRSKPYPKNVRSDESPRSATLRALNEAQKKAMAPFDETDNPDLNEDDEVILYSQEDNG